MDSNKAFELLLEVKDVLTKLDVKWWVDCGVLLGFVRDGDIISWDSDIDLGTFDYDKWPQIAKELRKQGYRIGAEYHPFPYMRSRRLSYNWAGVKTLLKKFTTSAKALLGGELDKDGIHISICIRDKTDDLMWTTTTAKKPDWYIGAAPLRYFEPLDSIIIKGYEFPIPNNVEDYLGLLYGKSWRVPMKLAYSDIITMAPESEKLEKISIEGVKEAIERWRRKYLR